MKSAHNVHDFHVEFEIDEPSLIQKLISVYMILSTSSRPS